MNVAVRGLIALLKDSFVPGADPQGGMLQLAMKAATITVAAQDGPVDKAADDGDNNAADCAAMQHPQRYYMDHMPLSTVQDVADPKQYAALCKARRVKRTPLVSHTRLCRMSECCMLHGCSADARMRNAHSSHDSPSSNFHIDTGPSKCRCLLACFGQAAIGGLPVERLVFCEQQEKLVALLAPQVCVLTPGFQLA